MRPASSRASMLIHVCVCVCVCVCIHIHTCVCVCVYVCVSVREKERGKERESIYTYIYIHTHKYIYTHIHVQVAAVKRSIVKRDLQNCQKRPLDSHIETHIPVPAIHPTNVSKETYKSVKRDLLKHTYLSPQKIPTVRPPQWQTRPTKVSKETY